MSRDKEKHKEAKRKHYQENKEIYAERLRQRRMEIRQWWENYKKEQKFECSICKESHLGCICFHHRDPKEKKKTISNLVRQAASANVILEEVKKCDVLCANCHAIHHEKVDVRMVNYEKGNNEVHDRRIKRAKWWKQYKEEKQFKCIGCGEQNLTCICFHHRDPKEKEYDISFLVGFAYSTKNILKELEKCDPLCMNCHSKFHWENDKRIRNNSQ